MLLEVRDKLRGVLKAYVDKHEISVYRGRLEKIKIGGFSINTINQIIKTPNYRVRNTTIVAIFDALNVVYDKDFYKQNDIVRLHEKQENDISTIQGEVHHEKEAIDRGTGTTGVV